MATRETPASGKAPQYERPARRATERLGGYRVPCRTRPPVNRLRAPLAKLRAGFGAPVAALLQVGVDKRFEGGRGVEEMLQDEHPGRAGPVRQPVAARPTP